MYLEEAAKTVHLASLRGQVARFSSDELERSFHFYEDNYGQKK